jgi:hypothetical protein
MKSNKCHTVGTVSKSSYKIGERANSNKIQITQTYINAPILGLVQAFP